MAYSLSFDGNDLGDYNLVVTSPDINHSGQNVPSIQLQDRGYIFRPQKQPRRIRIGFDVTGTSRSSLDGNLDSIKQIVTALVAKQLIFDTIATRYFNAILMDFSGQYLSASLFRGRMDFTCPDPLAYSVTETSNDFSIDSDPKTIEEVVNGGGYVSPVWTLTAGENLVAVTIKLENLTTIEELQWTGSLASAEELEIDVVRWLVSKEGVADMATITGKFPQLEGGIDNVVKVTGLSTTGSLNIKYRATYL